MRVIANNLANVTTLGFKRDRANFELCPIRTSLRRVQPGRQPEQAGDRHEPGAPVCSSLRDRTHGHQGTMQSTGSVARPCHRGARGLFPKLCRCPLVRPATPAPATSSSVRRAPSSSIATACRSIPQIHRSRGRGRGFRGLRRHDIGQSPQARPVPRSSARSRPRTSSMPAAVWRSAAICCSRPAASGAAKIGAAGFGRSAPRSARACSSSRTSIPSRSWSTWSRPSAPARSPRR